MAEEKEYIEKDVLYAKLSRMIDYCQKDFTVRALPALFQVADAIMDCKPADVVEIVRCKDCKHSAAPSSFHNKELWCENNRHGVNKLDFCSYGEKAKVEE